MFLYGCALFDNYLFDIILLETDNFHRKSQLALGELLELNPGKSFRIFDQHFLNWL